MNKSEIHKNDLIDYLSSLGKVCLDEPMCNHTSFKTGGPADIVFIPDSIPSLQKVICFTKINNYPLTILGGGSNLLVGDLGIRGIVVLLKNNEAYDGHITMKSDDLVYADSATGKEEFVDFCIARGFTGMEFMVGIPGCMGGGIVMNAGTTMGNFVDILQSVEYIDFDGKFKTVNITRDMAHYRHIDIENACAVLGGFFKLTVCEDIEGVKKTVREILDDRKNKHPLDYPSAGSVFKNPEGMSSWKLIDDAGLKGYAVGGAMISDLHTNFIINANNAKSSDILELINHIKNTVYKQFNVELHTEIKILGEF